MKIENKAERQYQELCKFYENDEKMLEKLKQIRDEEIEFAKKDIIEEIFTFRMEQGMNDYSLLEIIIEFANKNDYDIVDIADLIKRDNSFMAMLKEDMIKNHQIKVEKIFDEWE